MEREDSIIQDQIDMLRAKARAKEEEDLKAARKAREKAAQEQLRLENERDRAVKAEQKKKEYEAEKRMEEEYRCDKRSGLSFLVLRCYGICGGCTGLKLSERKKLELKHSRSEWKQ